MKHLDLQRMRIASGPKRLVPRPHPHFGNVINRLLCFKRYVRLLVTLFGESWKFIKGLLFVVNASCIVVTQCCVYSGIFWPCAGTCFIDM